MHLIDRVDSEGNTVLGRYNTPTITSLLGDGAFNGNIVAPWVYYYQTLTVGWLRGLGFLGTI